MTSRPGTGYVPAPRTEELDVARNTRVIADASPRDVFDVLRDGSSFASWVVGTRTIRDVEEGWPRPGTSIHFTAGYWPLRNDDRTQSLAYQADVRLELEAQLWPAGTARIAIEVEPVRSGVLVTLDEEPARGVLKNVHNPVLDGVVRLRNLETLRRLETVVRRYQAAAAATPR